MTFDTRPVVVHVMYRFDTGGLENGVVNLINHMPVEAYRHVVLALTEITDFKQRINRTDVEFISLHKPPGQGIWQFPRLYNIFRQLRPAIVHSRNLAAMEVQLPAWLARVPVRIHSEHGRDMNDIDGKNFALRSTRRFYKLFVNHFLALSRDLSDYLIQVIGIPKENVTQVYNGVDTLRFSPKTAVVPAISACPFNPAEHWLVGTVGRMQAIKDQTLLARAFVLALKQAPDLVARLRLVMVGDGPLRDQAQSILESAGIGHLSWLPGERADVPEIMRGLHAFVLPSLSEGISNTILEAMASGLPVIATEVGGNADLVVEGVTGRIVPPGEPIAMALRIVQFAFNPSQAESMGRAGRERVLQRFSLADMVSTYQQIYDQQLSRLHAPLQSN